MIISPDYDSFASAYERGEAQIVVAPGYSENK